MSGQVLYLGDTTQTRFKDVLLSICNAAVHNDVNIQVFRNRTNNTLEIPLRDIVALYLEKDFRSDDKNNSDTMTLVAKAFPDLLMNLSAKQLEALRCTFSLSNKVKRLKSAMLVTTQVDSNVITEQHLSTERIAQLLLARIHRTIALPVLDQEEIRDFISLSGRNFVFRIDRIPNNVNLVVKMRVKKERKRRRAVDDDAGDVGDVVAPVDIPAIVPPRPIHARKRRRTASTATGLSDASATGPVRLASGPPGTGQERRIVDVLNERAVLTVEQEYQDIDIQPLVIQLMQWTDQYRDALYNQFRDKTMQDIVQLHRQDPSQARWGRAILEFKSHQFA